MAEAKDNAEEKEISEDLRKSEARDNLFIAVTAVLAGIFLIFVIYQIVISPDQVLPLISCGVALIVDIFLMIYAIQRKFEVQKKLEERKFEEIFTAQKASYFVLRKNFDELNQRISDIEKAESNLPADEIVNAQKALAKVTINRNKENTDALMNSNDVLIAKFVELEEKISGNNGTLLEEEKKLLNSTRDALIQNNQELKYQLSDMNTEIKSLKADLKTIESQQRAIPQQPVMMAFQTMPQQMGMMPQMQPVYQTTVQTADVSQVKTEESSKQEAVTEAANSELSDETVPNIDDLLNENEEALGNSVDDTPSLLDDSKEDSLVQSEIEENIEIPVEEKEEAPLSGLEMAAKKAREKAEESAPSEVESIEDSEELSENSKEEVQPVEEVSEDADVESFSTDEAPSSELDLSSSGVDLSDPNATMSPDDIAALFAAAGSGDASTTEETSSLEEPIENSEEEISAVEEPIENPEEEISAVEEPNENPEEESEGSLDEAPSPELDLSSSGVDLSDPNATMSPDDIAALFAAAGNNEDNTKEETSTLEAETDSEEPASDSTPDTGADTGIDMSDPNKQLSPEEIAKLFASMS